MISSLFKGFFYLLLYFVKCPFIISREFQQIKVQHLLKKYVLLLGLSGPTPIKIFHEIEGFSSKLLIFIFQ